jgi:non-heme chloroperoxidase
VLVASLTPNMVKTDANPAGQPKEWFDQVQAGTLANRSEFFRAVPEGPFYGYNRPGAEPSEAVIANWWRQGMAGSAHAHYETVFSWLEDYTEDLQKITVPVLVMHGDDDQIVPYASSVPRAVDLLKNGTLKTYPGFPHGMLTTHADVLNPDLLAFIRS